MSCRRWRCLIGIVLTCISSSIQAGIGDCPGYNAYNVRKTDSGISADLKLAGPACNVYGEDIENLSFKVRYSSDSILHVQISDPDGDIYQVPEEILPRHSGEISAKDSKLEVVLNEEPFSFAIRRVSEDEHESSMAGETIFNSSGSNLIFETQYWRLRTSLPDDAHLYGLGEHTDPLQLDTKDYLRTFWNRDAGRVPEGENLYGSHPIYFENRFSKNQTSTHAVALINSNGMDVRVKSTTESGTYLEYNVLGGIVDLYFLSGTEPFEVSKQVGEVVGKAAMMPYWGLGYHQCRYGYANVFEIAEVVYNHSKAGIPLETMWTDIDYMERFKIFTLDPDNYPLDKMRELIAHLHELGQHYVVMIDPAIAYQNYTAFERASEQGILLQRPDGSLFKGVVWPGVTAFPDWFHADTQKYWTEQFMDFFDAKTGVNIDALWIDMNEPSNACPWPCDDPDAFLDGPGDWINPPPPKPIPYNPRPLPGWPDDFQPREQALPPKASSAVQRFEEQPGNQIKLIFEEQSGNQIKLTRSEHIRGEHKGLPDRNLLEPPYEIYNADGSLSNHGMDTDIVHANGLVEYDVHNLYGIMMSIASREAMLARQPSLRPLIVTRSTFLGSGRHVAHWLGDNFSSWEQYRQSIRHMLQFTAFFQMPMVGADVCGFLDNTTETLCARWARLGAFYPFFRNHNSRKNTPQEFYRWELTTEAAQKGIALRYRLLDYLYTAMHRQTADGTPLVFPLWMAYPQDARTAAIELQFFYGPALLVCPVAEADSKEVSIYLPDDLFYDLNTFAPVHGEGGRELTLRDVAYTEIPVFVRSGHIVPMRVAGANTTTVLRTQDFELLVAPRPGAADGQGKQQLRAAGELYLDDGVSLEQPATSEITFSLVDDELKMDGQFGYDVGDVRIVRAIVLDPEGGSVKNITLNWDLKGSKRQSLE